MTPKCEIQWIDSDGRFTPDENDAVAIAHHHEAIWSLPCGGLGNAIVGYTDQIRKSFPICQKHLEMAEKLRLHRTNGGWTFEPLAR